MKKRGPFDEADFDMAIRAGVRPSAKVKRVAAMLECDDGDVRRLLRQGMIEGHTIGKRGVRIFLDSVAAYQDQNTQVPQPVLREQGRRQRIANSKAHREAVARLRKAGYMSAIVLALLVFSGARGHAALSVSGVPWVIDGDTIDIHGTRIRLFGIDAPERKQSCERAGHDWRCGETAKYALIHFINHRSVSCEPRDMDRYGRTVAVCFLNGRDINGWMVTQGWAVAYRHYSRDYVRAEDGARIHHRGIWASHFELPWDWRHERH